VVGEDPISPTAVRVETCFTSPLKTLAFRGEDLDREHVLVGGHLLLTGFGGRLALALGTDRRRRLLGNLLAHFGAIAVAVALAGRTIPRRASPSAESRAALAAPPERAEPRASSTTWSMVPFM